MKRNLENKINNFNCCFLKRKPYILKKRVKTGRHLTFFDKCVCVKRAYLTFTHCKKAEAMRKKVGYAS